MWIAHRDHALEVCRLRVDVNTFSSSSSFRRMQKNDQQITVTVVSEIFCQFSSIHAMNATSKEAKDYRYRESYLIIYQ